MDAREQAREQLPWDVVQDVERRHRVDRGRVELELRDVPVEERRFGDAFPSAPELLGREVDRGEPEALGQQPRLIRAAAAAELDHAAASRKSRDELVAPVGPRIVGDLCLPRLPGVDHRVVAGRDESRARVRHATSTSSRPAACSARCSASMEVGAVAIT